MPVHKSEITKVRWINTRKTKRKICKETIK